MRLSTPKQTLTFPRRPVIMGIINVNDDSFSGDGSLDVKGCVERALEQIRQGADCIDVGAESARTNRGPITVEEEVSRVRAFLSHYKEALEELEAPDDPEQVWPPLLSLNTWRPQVVEELLPLGIDLLNDIGALPDSRNAELCARHQTALLMMHSIGLPKEPHLSDTYEDVIHTVQAFFEEKLEVCAQAGLPQDYILLDPGIDFAKQKEDNLRIYAHLDRLHSLNRPILLPVSRKTVIGEVLRIKDPAARDAGTVACIAAGMRAGAHFFRVHNVEAAVQTVKTLWAIHQAGETASS